MQNSIKNAQTTIRLASKLLALLCLSVISFSCASMDTHKSLPGQSTTAKLKTDIAQQAITAEIVNANTKNENEISEEKAEGEENPETPTIVKIASAALTTAKTIRLVTETIKNKVIPAFLTLLTAYVVYEVVS